MFELAKEDTYKGKGMTDEAIAKAMKLPGVPLPGEEVYKQLKLGWEARGFTKMWQVCEEYITSDVRPFIRIIEKFQQSFQDLDLSVFKDYISLPVRFLHFVLKTIIIEGASVVIRSEVHKVHRSKCAFDQNALLAQAHPEAHAHVHEW